MSTPDALGPGRILFAAGIVALGVQSLILTDFLWLEPVPAWLPARAVQAGITGAILMIAGLGIIADCRTRAAASALGLVLLLWVIVLHLPVLVLEPGNGGVWGSGFKVVALSSAALLLGAVSAKNGIAVDRRHGFAGRMATCARIGFGTALLVFGVLHLVYHDYIASLIPDWIPGRPYWPYFTGVAQIAAGASILTTIRMRLAASLLGMMYGLWVLMLHVPRVLAEPRNPQEWTELFMAVALCGGALLVADSSAAAGGHRGQAIGPTASEIGQ